MLHIIIHFCGDLYEITFQIDTSRLKARRCLIVQVNCFENCIQPLFRKNTVK